MDEDVTHAIAAIENGVHGYVLKHSDPSDLLSAIRSVIAGKRYVDPTIAHDVFRSLRSDNSPAKTLLTDQQNAVLRHLAEGKTAREIAPILDLNHRTVEYHKYRVMDLLDINSSAELIKYAVQQGLT